MPAGGHTRSLPIEEPALIRSLGQPLRRRHVDATLLAESHSLRAQWGLSIKQLAYLGTQEVKTLGKLKPPKDLEEGFRTFIDTKTGAFADLLQGADAAKRNRTSEIKAPIDAGRAALAKASKQAKALGLAQCA